MKERNKPIGEVVCPFKACDEKCGVFKYRARADDDTRRRFAGKLYAKCERHGKTEDQEYLLEHATLWPNGTAPASVGEQESGPTAAAAETQKAPEKTASAPVTKAPALTSQQRSTPPAPPAKTKSSAEEWFW